MVTTTFPARRPSAGTVPGRWGLLGGKDPPAAFVESRSIVVQDRAEAAPPGEQGVAAEPEQVEVEGLVGLPLAVALDLDRDVLRRLAGCEGQRAGPGDVIVVAGRRRAVYRAERHRHRLVVTDGTAGDREGDREGEQVRLTLLTLGLCYVGDADLRLVVNDGAHGLTVGDGRVGRAAQIDEERLVRLAEAVAVDRHGDRPRRLAGGDGQRARGGLVVAAGRRRTVGGGV